MNKLTKQVIVFSLGAIAFFFAFGIVGNIERAEQIIYTMPQEVYDVITEKLGKDCSDIDIADEYMANRDYYNSLAQ